MLSTRYFKQIFFHTGIYLMIIFIFGGINIWQLFLCVCVCDFVIIFLGYSKLSEDHESRFA